MEIFPFDVRIQNALVSYVIYIGKTIWPSKLAIFYPYPAEVWPVWQVILSGLFLAVTSIIAIRWLDAYRYFIVGWLWYVGTLIPVIGFIQVGTHAMADRYTYVPLIGIFIVVAWGLSDFSRKWNYGIVFVAVLSSTVLAALIIGTWFQLQHWKNSITVFAHAAQVTERNYFAHNNLGLALMDEGFFDDAVKNMQAATLIKPHYGVFHNNLGVALLRQEKTDEAIFCFLEALRLNIDDWGAHYNLGNALMAKGSIEDAIFHYQKSIVGRPSDVRVQRALGDALMRKGEFDKAIFHYNKALLLDPGSSELHNNLGVALAHQGKLNEAVEHFNEALRLSSNYPDAYKNLQTTMQFIKKSEIPTQ